MFTSGAVSAANLKSSVATAVARAIVIVLGRCADATLGTAASTVSTPIMILGTLMAHFNRSLGGDFERPVEQMRRGVPQMTW